jgi:hypothetical protein
VSITDGWNASSAKMGPPRLQRGAITTALQLGPLANLVGSWIGPGFNAIWRPDNIQPPANSAIHRFLELNLTTDSFHFHVIPGTVPNRGFNTQADLNLYGLHYLQRTSDADAPPFSTAGQALHIEPGLFMNVPGSEANDNAATIVRMGSIPHGTTVLMQGPNPGAEVTAGPPTIPAMLPFQNFPGAQPFSTTTGVGIQPISIAPSTPGSPGPPPVPGIPYGAEHLVPENTNTSGDAAFPASQSNGPFPPAFQGFVNDPNSVLRDAIAGQDILGFHPDQSVCAWRGTRNREHPIPGLPEHGLQRQRSSTKSYQCRRYRPHRVDHNAKCVRLLRGVDILDRVREDPLRSRSGPRKEA